MLFRSEIDSFYPYLFNLSEFDTLEHNTIFAPKDREFFNFPANEKLGFVYRDCNKTLVNKTLTWIQQAGVPSSQLVTYNFGCPSAFASPATSRPPSSSSSRTMSPTSLPTTSPVTMPTSPTSPRSSGSDRSMGFLTNRS
jgi:hypothetical protein